MPGSATQGIEFDELLIFERGSAGRSGASLPRCDVPAIDPAVYFGANARKVPADLAEVSEPEVQRHFTRLSQKNFSIDTAFYPLGSCTMKYNPRINEWAARLSGFARLHPYAPERMIQGALQLMHDLERALAEVCGMDDVTLQPAAGAQGELTGLMMIRAYHTSQGRSPRRVLIPDTAHGTNAASCALNGLITVPFPSGPNGVIEVETVRKLCEQFPGDIAAIMMTNPNTLGLFESNIMEIAEVVHAAGGQVYGDGANLNAIMGKVRPGDVGIDVMQFNLHKTFTTPHGGGGPGCGPVAFKSHLVPFQPAPVVARDDAGAFRWDTDRPQTVGRLRSFYGNFGMMVRAYAYIREMGREGLKEASEMAVLNANYVRVKIADTIAVAFPGICMHEVVLTDKDLAQKYNGGKTVTLDLAKRLIDYGFHPPTVYFPLVVQGALMIEPTETETRQTLDFFLDALKAIVRELEESPETVHKAPHQTRMRRLNEAQAARKPVLRWTRNSASTS
ncbi:MAG: aminomethyl-transferring glycine dehydrogenase subunit GcvPB [Deltaproteobacteria bacterium]|nr:aminomethyl-transferring glycine dehydrogenase subunit GcvPB [Deltaproteobacteria bacterium]